MKSPIIIVYGPTGSGKSLLAYKIAKAYNGELISADSRQIYTHARIGTNKTEFPDIPTHLIDICEPNDEYSAYDFKHDALESISIIQKKGKLPIIVGGTNFYINVLIGKQLLTQHSEVFLTYQQEEQKKLAVVSIESLQHMYQKLDKAAFDKLSHSEQYNTHRLIKKILTAQFKNMHPENLPQDRQYIRDSAIVKIGITCEQEMLYKDIAQRVNTMIQDGLKKEVIQLITQYTPDITLLHTIGYKEYIQEAKKQYADFSLYEGLTMLTNEDEEKVKKFIYYNTIHYAKHQMTWLKKDKDIVWIDKRNDLSNKVISEVIKKNTII